MLKEMKVLASGRMRQAAFDILDEKTTLTAWQKGGRMPQEEFEKLLSEADALFSAGNIKIDEALLSKAPKLKVAAQSSVGYDNIDVAACRAHGVRVGNTPGVLVEAVADLAYGWRILDRETFLVLWIVIFAMLGFYLLGKIRFSHDSELKYVSVPRLFMAIVSLAFAVYMVPGLWGAPLKSISAFAPPLYTQDFNLYEDEVHAQFDDYEAGMAYAKKNNKPVMIDFSGYGCVNCRKMEASVWTNPGVKQIIENDYVLITLFVDDKTKLPEVIEIEEHGKTRKLKTVGDKWSYLQRSKFGANAQPFYVLLDNNGKPLSHSYAYDEDVNKYIQFLQGGLKNYKK